MQPRPTHAKAAHERCITDDSWRGRAPHLPPLGNIHEGGQSLKSRHSRVRAWPGSMRRCSSPGGSTAGWGAARRGPRGNGEGEAESSRWHRRKRAQAASIVSAQPTLWPRPMARWPCPAGGARSTDGRAARRARARSSARAGEGEASARSGRAGAASDGYGLALPATARVGAATAWRGPTARARGDEKHQPVVPTQGKLENDKVPSSPLCMTGRCVLD
uniref:Predicted protein n=1 Tax=Hordeum vulgare subsp. vulgare TaxID=112509 RepID=F2ECW0_HORVV|nr:predicted protein [Hordeum vulgare subsp. vulgare]